MLPKVDLPTPAHSSVMAISLAQLVAVWSALEQTVQRQWRLLQRVSEPVWMHSCGTPSRNTCVSRGIRLGDLQRFFPTPTILLSQEGKEASKL